MSTLILAVDHRNSLRGWLAALGVQPDEIGPTARPLKCVCVEALAQARDQLQPGDTAMLLLDEEYGADAIRAAKQAGLPIVIPAEQSGKDGQEAAHRIAAAHLDLAVVYRGAAQAAVSRIGIGH